MLDDIIDFEGLPVFGVFHEMGQEYREAVVERALVHLHAATGGERRSNFWTLVRDNVKGVDGFRDASRAPVSRLIQPVSKEALIVNKLASGVLGLWLESHETLQGLVQTHLESAGITAEYLDLPGCQFKGVWLWDIYEREMEGFIERYPDYYWNDVALMFKCVSGKLPVEMTGEGEDSWEEEDEGFREVDEEMLPDVLAKALAYLRSLPVTAAEWGEEVPGFIRAANDIMKAKETARSMAESLDATLSDVRERFDDLLEFFECDAEGWAAVNLVTGLEVLEVALLASTLESLLTEYQVVHLPAAVLTEERERAKSRAGLQTRILDAVGKIRQAHGQLARPLLEPSPPVPQETSLGTAPEVQGDSADEPENPAESESAEADPSVSQADYESLQSLTQDLEQDKEQLQQELKRLENGLYESQQREESWRVAYWNYDESRKGVEDDIEVEELGMDDVATAVALAAERFEGRLLFQLNSESAVEGNPFERPYQVWKALQWLATTYYDSRMGEITVTDFDLSVRKACGWWYKSSQGQSTLTTYRNSYTTKHQGKTYWLEEHIGKGTNRDSRYTIRIAFDWDRDLKVVVVGYIGRHQQTDFS